MPCANPSQVGWWNISAVHCVIARTKTRSKKSSSGITRSPSRSTGLSRGARVVVAVAIAPHDGGSAGFTTVSRLIGERQRAPGAHSPANLRAALAVREAGGGSSTPGGAGVAPNLRGEIPGPVALLLGDRLAGTAQLFGEVLELGEAIFHGQHGRLVIDVHSGCKRKCRDRRRVDVDQTPLRVAGEQMAAADLAPLPIAPLVLVVLADLVFSLGHLDRLGLPEREGVDGAGGPAPTCSAMAVAGALGIALDGNRDGAAVALPFVGLFLLAHEFSLRSSAMPNWIERLQRPGGHVRSPSQ